MIRKLFMSLKQNDTFYESKKELEDEAVSCGKGTFYPQTCDMLHEDDCDCSACVEKIMEERHEWDYDNASDMELMK